MDIYIILEQALMSADADEKCRLAWMLQTHCEQHNSLMRVSDSIIRDFRLAGHPDKPDLVPPALVKSRKPSTPEGYAALLHAITHIEFNAINLALDAAYRFRRLPEQFTRDWIQVASEEATHFSLMRNRLRAWGYDYGDFPAHNHLWDMAYKTAFDPLLRMALVPRVLEARGLDVTPGIQEKVLQKCDEETHQVLSIIYRDEVGHVAIGNRWYQYLCEQRGLDAVMLFRRLLERYDLFIFRGYVNIAAREEAGFSEFELAMLEDFEQSRNSSRTNWQQALSR